PGARREALDRRMEQRRLRDRQLAGADHAEDDAVERVVRAADEQQAAECEERHDAHAADRPADEREDAGDPEQEQPPLQHIAGGDQRWGSGRGPSESPFGGSSSSSRPRGGQSSFCGASQRLEQWSEAMFWRGTRMCPFSSMWATSSTKQYAVSTPSWYSPPKSATSTCSPLYLLV